VPPPTTITTFEHYFSSAAKNTFGFILLLQHKDQFFPAEKTYCMLEKWEAGFLFTCINWWDRNLFLQGDSCSFHNTKKPQQTQTKQLRRIWMSSNTLHKQTWKQ